MFTPSIVVVYPYLAFRVRALIVSASSKLVPSGLGLRPRAHVCLVSFFFPRVSSLSFSFVFFFVFVRLCLFYSLSFQVILFKLVYLYTVFYCYFYSCFVSGVYIPWTCMYLVFFWLQIIRDGMVYFLPQLVSTVPLRTVTTATAVHTLLRYSVLDRFLPSNLALRRFVFVQPVLRPRGLHIYFREMS